MCLVEQLDRMRLHKFSQSLHSHTYYEQYRSSDTPWAAPRDKRWCCAVPMCKDKHVGILEHEGGRGGRHIGAGSEKQLQESVSRKARERG